MTLKPKKKPLPIELRIEDHRQEGVSKDYQTKIERSADLVTSRKGWPDDACGVLHIEIHDNTPNAPREPLSETWWTEVEEPSGDWRKRLCTALAEAAGASGHVYIKSWHATTGKARHYWR